MPPSEAWCPVDLRTDPHEAEYRGDPSLLYDALGELLEGAERPWVAQAACRGKDTAIWFPDRAGGSSKEAQAICDPCPVKDPCLAYALADPSIDGCWAGTSKQTRQAMRKAAA